MQLQSSNLAHYLLGRGGVARGRVMSGDFMVVDVGRRNKNFKVLHQDGSGVFVKQARDESPNACLTLEREASFYRALVDEPVVERLSTLCPRFVAWDPRAHVLVVELLRGGRSWQDLQGGRAELSVEWAAAVGVAVAKLHLAGAAALADGAASKLPALPRSAPWVLSFGDWNAASPTLSRPHAQLLAQVQATPILLQGLWRLRREWLRTSLIHGDMKWDNVVLFGFDEPEPAARMVDWELVDLGDPAWDLAGLLQSFVVHWLGRFPDLAGSSLQALCAADPRLAGFQVAVSAFLSAYRAETLGSTRLTPHDSARAWRAFMERVTRLMAARLLQTVYELEAVSPGLSPRGALVTAMCGVIVSQPTIALDQLFGGAT